MLIFVFISEGVFALYPNFALICPFELDPHSYGLLYFKPVIQSRVVLAWFFFFFSFTLLSWTNEGNSFFLLVESSCNWSWTCRIMGKVGPSNMWLFMENGNFQVEILVVLTPWIIPLNCSVSSLIPLFILFFFIFNICLISHLDSWKLLRIPSKMGGKTFSRTTYQAIQHWFQVKNFFLFYLLRPIFKVCSWTRSLSPLKFFQGLLLVT